MLRVLVILSYAVHDLTKCWRHGVTDYKGFVALDACLEALWKVD